MTKKILPTMIGVALAGGMTAAAADVSIFGHIDESVVFWNDDSFLGLHDFANGNLDGDDTNFVCTTCSIGFKGSEDLGNGLSAIFSLDFEYDINNRHRVSSTTYTYTTTSGTFTTTLPTGSGAITDRDQWVGLAGGFGKVRVGTISTVYKSHGAMLDPGYRTVAQMRDIGIQSNLHSGAGEEGQGRATNTLRWDSPDWNGFQAGATFTLDSNEADGEDNNPYGFGVSYTNGGILAFADYLTSDNGGNDDAWKVGGKYSMDSFSVFGQYESDGGLISSKGVMNNTVDGADVWMLGGSFTMGSNTVYAAYGNGDDNSTGSGGYDSWEIVGVHGFSKNTLVYGGYLTIEPDATGVSDADAFTVGMKHKF